MLTAKITHGFAICSRDERGFPVIQEVTRNQARAYLKNTCCTELRRGLTGYRIMVLANGTSLRIDRFIRGRVAQGRA